MSDHVRYEFTPNLAMHLLPWYKVRLKIQGAVSGVNGLQESKYDYCFTIFTLTCNYCYIRKLQLH